MSPSLSLDVQPAGRGTIATVTARAADGEAVACERLDLARKASRQKFIASLCDRVEEVDADTLDQRLVAAAADLAAPPPPAAAAAGSAELGDGRVVRPERFILPTVSGLAVPRQILRDGEPSTDWLLLLRWQDGKREAVPLPDVLSVDGEQVFIYPRPPLPPPGMSPGWAAADRQAWVEGEPATEPDELCRLLMESFGKYLDLPKESAAGILAMLTCWSLLSYVFPPFDAVPYISVGGPAGSGKSRVFELLAQMVFRPLSTSNLSNPALFRSMHSFGGVALLDEAERLRESRSPEVAELLSSLLAGYKRGGCATRCEAAGDGQFIMRHFQVFGPKAVASINEPPTALASRCIPLPMFRSPKGSQKPRLRVEGDAKRWRMLRHAMHGIAMEHGSEWLDLPSRQDVVPEMSGRNFELWQPLLSLAAWFEDRGAAGLLSVLQEHALRCIESSREAATPPDDEVLLLALAQAVRSLHRPTAGELLAVAQQQEPSLFAKWSARAVSAHLARYGIRSRKTDGRHVFDPATADLLRVQESYGIDLDLADMIDPEEPPPEPARRRPATRAAAAATD
jgi:hypothetical protein